MPTELSPCIWEYDTDKKKPITNESQNPLRDFYKCRDTLANVLDGYYITGEELDTAYYKYINNLLRNGGIPIAELRECYTVFGKYLVSTRLGSLETQMSKNQAKHFLEAITKLESAAHQGQQNQLLNKQVKQLLVLFFLCLRIWF